MLSESYFLLLPHWPHLRSWKSTCTRSWRAKTYQHSYISLPSFFEVLVHMPYVEELPIFIILSGELPSADTVSTLVSRGQHPYKAQLRIKSLGVNDLQTIEMIIRRVTLNISNLRRLSKYVFSSQHPSYPVEAHIAYDNFGCCVYSNGDYPPSPCT
jgi:hypothetical protein